jgi:sensor histidine kinase regulating citrate/malate metabolism
VEEPEKRVISLNISIKSNFLVIHMDNYSEKDPEFEDGIPMTTKADKDFHGYGMRSIKYITDKYNGTMSVNSANNIFALNIIFPAAS